MMKSLLAYIAFDLRVVLRERVALLLTVVLPALLYLLFGSLTLGRTSPSVAAHYYATYTASFTGVILLQLGLMNVGPVLVVYKEMGLFRRLLVTPLDMSAIWIASIVRAFLIFIAGYGLMIVSGWIMFGQWPSTSFVQLVTSTSVCAFSILSLGVLLGSLFTSSRAAFNAGVIIFQPMVLFSGAAFPLDRYPDWLQWISKLIPMTYVVDILRSAWSNHYRGAGAVIPTLFLLSTGVLCASLARRAFRWSHAH